MIYNARYLSLLILTSLAALFLSLRIPSGDFVSYVTTFGYIKELNIIEVLSFKGIEFLFYLSSKLLLFVFDASYVVHIYSFITILLISVSISRLIPYCSAFFLFTLLSLFLLNPIIFNNLGHLVRQLLALSIFLFASTSSGRFFPGIIAFATIFIHPSIIPFVLLYFIINFRLSILGYLCLVIGFAIVEYALGVFSYAMIRFAEGNNYDALVAVNYLFYLSSLFPFLFIIHRRFNVSKFWSLMMFCFFVSFLISFVANLFGLYLLSNRYFLYMFAFSILFIVNIKSSLFFIMMMKFSWISLFIISIYNGPWIYSLEFL